MVEIHLCKHGDNEDFHRPHPQCIVIILDPLFWKHSHVLFFQIRATQHLCDKGARDSLTNNLELFEVVLKRDPGGGGDGVVRDQPAHRVHGLPPPARPLAHQAEANRLQAARGGGGLSYSADQSLLRKILTWKMTQMCLKIQLVFIPALPHISLKITSTTIAAHDFPLQSALSTHLSISAH